MLWQIMRNDWRNLRADRTLWAVATLLAAAIAYGAYNGATWTRFQASTLQAAAEEERARLAMVKRSLEEVDAGRINPPAFLDPRSPAAVGRRLGVRYAAMPPAPLAPLAIGQSDLYPYYVKVSTTGSETFLNNDEIEHPVHLLSGRFDLAFVILYLYPLLILALGYNLVSGEKEAGTLALTLSQPVTLRALVAGKVALRFSFVLGLVLLLSLAGAALGGARLSADGSLLRLALWAAVVAGYGAFWFALAAVINGLGRSSAANAMALSGFWLALVLLLPSVLNVFIKVAHPVPSRVEMINAMRSAASEASAQGDKLLSRYLQDHPELAGETANPHDFSVLRIAVESEVERKMRPVLHEFDRQLERQQALLDRYRFLSPAIAVQTALFDLAGTSTHRYRHFVGLVGEFHEAWRAWFAPRTLRGERLTPADIEALPTFRFEEEPVHLAAARVREALAGLLWTTLAAAAAAFLALRRCRLTA